MKGPFEYSKSRIDAAGAFLRTALREDRDFDDDVHGSMVVVESFRGAHVAPLDVVTNQLFELSTPVLGADPVLSNRLKRYPQILRKLLNQPTLRLSTMNDVGGCRLVADADELSSVVGLVQSTLNVVDEDDYRSRPRASGYRAHHVIVLEGACRIEIQLRTPAEQAWAAWVEDLSRSGTWGSPKEGVTFEELAALLQRVSEMLAAGTLAMNQFEEIRRQLRD